MFIYYLSRRINHDKRQQKESVACKNCDYMWFFSDIKLSFLILVIIPVSISIIGILGLVPYLPIIGLGYFAITFVFGFYPHRYSAVEYFDKERFENAVIEYEYIKKIVYIEIPIVVAVTVINILMFVPKEVSLLEQVSLSTITNLSEIIKITENHLWGLFAPMNILTNSITAGIIWIKIQNIKKDFQFYFAKAYFNIIGKKEDEINEINKINYFVKGIKSYDNYLRRNLNLRINTEEIFSNVIGDTAVDTTKIMGEIGNLFANDHDEHKESNEYEDELTLEGIYAEMTTNHIF